MATNLLSCFSIQCLEQLLKFLANFTLLKYVKSQRSYGFLITKELIFGFQILDLKDHFSASLIAIFQMFTIWQMSRKGVNNMLCFLHTNISNVHCFTLLPCQGRKYVHFLKQHFKCLLFHIYPRVGDNNMPTFMSICQMFTISHIFPCQGK